MFHLKRKPLVTTHEHLHAQNNKTNSSIEFLQSYPVVEADALLEIGTAVISAVLSLDEHLSQTNTSCVPKFCYQSVYVVFFGTSVPGYALLNTSRTTADDSDAKQCSRMITRSAHEYTIFTPAQLLRKWREQRPSNQGVLDSSVTGEVGRVYYTGGGPASDFIFVS
jgi:hypothetical protein